MEPKAPRPFLRSRNAQCKKVRLGAWHERHANRTPHHQKKEENNYKAEQTAPCGKQACEWLEYRARIKNIHIQHKFNTKEKQVGHKNIRVDSWCMDTHTIYQFHGCLFHGHSCHLTRGKTINPINRNSLTELGKNTANITRYLREDVRVTVVEMWECEWQRQKHHNTHIKQFIQSRFPALKPFQSASPIAEQAVLDAVKNDTLFGLIECDIHVPNHLEDHFS